VKEGVAPLQESEVKNELSEIALANDLLAFEKSILYQYFLFIL
tara:strand:+ start:289 stop:417 length:129 start_codon:yes stop_codon:yes gene_type:complete